MSRKRVLSQNKAVYVSPTGFPLNTGYYPDQLHRIDTFSFDIDLAGLRTDIREFGQLGRIGTVSMTELNPSLSFGYYLGNGENEKRLGFQTSGISGSTLRSQFASGIIADTETAREKNIYVVTVGDNDDAFATATFTGTRANHDTIGFGNVTLTNYTVNFAVGEIPRVDIEAEASNIVFYENSSGLANPSIDQAGAKQAGTFALTAPSTGDMNVLVLRPDDVTVSFDTNGGGAEIGGAVFNNMHIQSCTIECPLTRQNIRALGSTRAVVRALEFPITTTMSINALVKDFKAGALDMILTGTAAADQSFNISVNVKNDANTDQHIWKLINARLDSQNFAMGLDDNETVDLTFSAQIGGPTTTGYGLFYSGLFTGAVDNTGVGNTYAI